MAPVTAFFAGVFALIYLGLSLYIIVNRYKMRLALGDGGNADMNRRIRAHANFAEYVPFILLLMALAELNGASIIFIKCLGIALVLARLSHAYSLVIHEVRPRGRIIFRQLGMFTTFTIMAILACKLLMIDVW